MQRKDHANAWTGSGSIDEVENRRSQEQRTATSEQRIGWVALGARSIDRDRDCGSRRGYDARCGERRRSGAERSCRSALALRGAARDVRDRTATRGTQRRTRRCWLLVGIGLRRAAARGADHPIVRASIPGRRRHRWRDDQGQQDHHDAAHVAQLYAPCGDGQRYPWRTERATLADRVPRDGRRRGCPRCGALDHHGRDGVSSPAAARRW